MNAPLSRADLERLAVHSADLMAQLVPNVPSHSKRHGSPFSKRSEGRARRAERKDKAARRFDWTQD